MGERHLVIGAGEVGTAIESVLVRRLTHDVQMIDIVEPSYRGQADVLHVCFPWSNRFTSAVIQYQERRRADLVIVHSTVPVGTCDPNGWVHSPVRGRHPDLDLSLFAFMKHFGGRDAKRAADIFKEAGMRTQWHHRAAETEAAKIWELVQYGQNILTEKKIHDWCEEHGLDFQVVYQMFAITYNKGYRNLGLFDFTRPVIKHMPGPIGGHCVREGSRLLDHPLAQEVAES